MFWWLRQVAHDKPGGPIAGIGEFLIERSWRAGEGEEGEGNGERKIEEKCEQAVFKLKYINWNCVRKVRIDSTKDNVSSRVDLAEVWRFSSPQVCQLLRWTRVSYFNSAKFFIFKIRKKNKSSNWLRDHKEDHFTSKSAFMSRPTLTIPSSSEDSSPSHFSRTPLLSRHHDTFFTTTCHQLRPLLWPWHVWRHWSVIFKPGVSLIDINTNRPILLSLHLCHKRWSANWS